MNDTTVASLVASAALAGEARGEANGRATAAAIDPNTVSASQRLILPGPPRRGACGARHCGWSRHRRWLSLRERLAHHGAVAPKGCKIPGPRVVARDYA